MSNLFLLYYSGNLYYTLFVLCFIAFFSFLLHFEAIFYLTVIVLQHRHWNMWLCLRGQISRCHTSKVEVTSQPQWQPPIQNLKNGICPLMYSYKKRRKNLRVCFFVQSINFYNNAQLDIILYLTSFFCLLLFVSKKLFRKITTDKQ